MNNYVISLHDHSTRRNHIISEFGNRCIPFQFFDAITPDQIATLAKKFKILLDENSLTPGELACLFSHISLWQHCLDAKLDYITVFEDDVYLGNVDKTILTSYAWIKDGIDIIKLEIFESNIDMKLASIEVVDNRKLRPLTGVHLGAAGYILSRHACKYLIQAITTLTRPLASDHILFELCLNEKAITAYQLTPALCIQSDRLHILKNKHSNKAIFVSSLETDRRKRFNQIKRQDNNKQVSYYHKLKRELFRIFRQIKNFQKKIYINFFCNINFK